MDTLPLPPSPSLEQYKKRAKALVDAARSTDPSAVRDWARQWLESLAASLGASISPFVRDSIGRAVEHIESRVNERGGSAPAKPFLLADAQHLIAGAHGFATWGAFAQHVEEAEGKRRPYDDFERAADAVVSGDLATLESLVRANPSLIRARSRRVHRATLLHYVAANGVEDFRQMTPKNAVAIARFLLDAGAEVDAAAETYGGGYWQTTMNLLVSSAHPAGAGLMPALVDVLMDYGAAANGVGDDESPIMTALDFGYGDAAETLAKRGARIDNVVTAAALGRIDLIRRFVVDKSSVAPGVPLVAPRWRKLPDDPTAHIELALAWACKFARANVAEFLLELGVDPASKDGYDMTALHWAAPNGMTTVVHRLLSLGAPLEVLNVWKGTVLDSTIHFAVHMPVNGVDYPAMLETLIAAGADVNAAYPSGDERIDALLRHHGAGSAT
ncbi:MAG TPA: ankyrin repeat domain-containing protein [Gemmatimonadaceae bacterium]|jgi:ankyrin repeat protein|nr:ankyrin repeat domain-containing protein [Gemmatimonadaceae bacterium]